MSKALESVKPLIKGIVLHWTAGDYKTTYDDYHFCITWDEKAGANVVQTRSVKSVGAHTWKRNTGRIGISLCSENWVPGKPRPTKPEQIEKMAKLVAELCLALDMDLDGTHKAWTLSGSRMVDIPNVTDHLFYSKLDGYGKIDIGKFLPVVMVKAKWYMSKIKSGEQKLEFSQKTF